MPSIEVCLSTDLVKYYDVHNKNVVVIDILRATTCICCAFEEGAKEILSFSSPTEALAMREQGYLIAGEQNGIKIDGFDLGNSPFDYINHGVKDKKIAISTTNGTKALKASDLAENVFIGSFLNIESLAKNLKGLESNLILFCAGWKGLPNTEDTLFAGMLISILHSKGFNFVDDASELALEYYKSKSEHVYDVLLSSAHARRLSKHIDPKKDIEYASMIGSSPLIPKYVNGLIKV